MTNLLLISAFTALTLSSTIVAQQEYSGNSVLDCSNGAKDSSPSSAYLYTCNGQLRTCRAFLIFRAIFPYNTVPSIAALLSSNASEITRLNNASSSLTAFPADKEVVVPVQCSCSGQYYEARTRYQIPSPEDTYFLIANSTYQGLSTCSSIEGENKYGELSLKPGMELHVPLRCACPTKEQAENGTEYLLTYPVSWGDNILGVSERFNVSTRKIVEGNKLSDESSNLYPFTTVLIPLSSEPVIKSRDNIVPVPPHPRPESNVSRKRSKTGLYIGSGVAAGLFLLISVTVFSVLFKFQRRKKKGNPAEDILVEIASIDHSLENFKFKDLRKATGDFSPRNRIRGSSSVYLGVLKGGEVVAIKKTTTDASEEVKVLNTINHFNLVTLHGFSVYQGCYYLVFEYMKNNSLREWLNLKTPGGTESWTQRIQIALDVANGLNYLHSFTKPGYIHKNISSRNILLDSNLRAKIANFSFVKSVECPTTGKIAGTRGYVAPEYLDTATVTPKTDIYAFGVVLLELITGKSAVFVHEGRERLLSAAVVSILRGENAETELASFIEADLRQDDGLEHAFQIAKLALMCLATDPAHRPGMSEVVHCLLKINANLQKVYQELQLLE